MIDPKKHYRTRDGREVRIYVTDGGGTRPVHGAFWSADKRWSVRSWRPDGRTEEDETNNLDLIEVKPRIKRKAWVNVYRDGLGTTCKTRSHADRQPCAENRIACVEIDIDVEEGHGL